MIYHDLARTYHDFHRCYPFAKFASRKTGNKCDILDVDECFACAKQFETKDDNGDNITYVVDNSNHRVEIVKYKNNIRTGIIWNIKRIVYGVQSTLQSIAEWIDISKGIQSIQYVYTQNGAPFGVHQIKNGIFGRLKTEIEECVFKMGQFNHHGTAKYILDSTCCDVMFDKFGYVQRIKFYFCAGYTYGSQQVQGLHASNLHSVILKWLPEVKQVISDYYGDDLSEHNSVQINFYFKSQNIIRHSEMIL